MTSSTAIVYAFATTTGQIMTDGIPLIVYCLGLSLLIFVLGLIFKFTLKPIKKIFK